ncbi:MAG TPA: hypothetical protein VHZ98_09460 [Galbitalea sp.]|jgi:hypothetical protein|nr:hypothetical protein [Galbitalea sp.]
MLKSVVLGATAFGGIPVQFVIMSSLFVVIGLTLAFAVIRMFRAH